MSEPGVDPASIPDRELGLQLRLQLCLQRGLGKEEARFLEHWGASLALEDDEGETTEVIGRAHLVRGSLGVSDMVDRLDDEDVNLGEVAAAVLDARTGEPKPYLTEGLVGFEAKFLIVGTVELEPGWRGRGIGRWFAAEALEALSPGASFAALLATPMDDSRGLERKRAESKLRATWAAIGFERHGGNVMVLDLGTVVLGDRVATLRKVFGA